MAASALLVMNGVSAVAFATEACGIVGSTDYLFANGFEAAATEIAARTSLVLRSDRSVIQSPSGTPTPTVSITFPSAAQTLPGIGTSVVGTFTGPADTGIVVNGVVAYTVGNTFLVQNVPIVAGANTLQATATTLQGLTATSSIGVNQSGAAPAVALTSKSIAGFAPFTQTFSAVVQSGITVNQIRVDFDGDGIDDLTTTDPTVALSHNYLTPGLYTARLTLVDNTTSTTYISYRRILAQDLVEVRETLCGVYGYLRTNLAAADVPHALLAFDPDRQAHYQTFFGSISTANLPVAAARLGIIANGIFHPDFVQLKVVKMY